MMIGFSLVERPDTWLDEMCVKHHYMHRAIHQRSSHFGWALSWNGDVLRPDGRPNGFVVYASIHFTRLRDEFGYEGLPTKWQVLSLARLWIHPDFQAGGELFTPDILPGFIDRKGIFRSTLASSMILSSFGLVQSRWLEVHPPRFLEEPYHILKIISFCDTRFFTGAVYRATGFRYTGMTVSQRRHKNTRGPGMDGAQLMRFIYDLPEPAWLYQPAQMQFEGVS